MTGLNALTLIWWGCFRGYRKYEVCKLHTNISIVNSQHSYPGMYHRIHSYAPYLLASQQVRKRDDKLDDDEKEELELATMHKEFRRQMARANLCKDSGSFAIRAAGLIDRVRGVPALDALPKAARRMSSQILMMPKALPKMASADKLPSATKLRRASSQLFSSPRVQPKLPMSHRPPPPPLSTGKLPLYRSSPALSDTMITNGGLEGDSGPLTFADDKSRALDELSSSNLRGLTMMTSDVPEQVQMRSGVCDEARAQLDTSSRGAPYELARTVVAAIAQRERDHGNRERDQRLEEMRKRLRSKFRGDRSQLPPPPPPPTASLLSACLYRPPPTAPIPREPLGAIEKALALQSLLPELYHGVRPPFKTSSELPERLQGFALPSGYSEPPPEPTVEAETADVGEAEAAVTSEKVCSVDARSESLEGAVQAVVARARAEPSRAELPELEMPHGARLSSDAILKLARGMLRSPAHSESLPPTDPALPLGLPQRGMLPPARLAPEMPELLRGVTTPALCTSPELLNAATATTRPAQLLSASTRELTPALRTSPPQMASELLLQVRDVAPPTRPEHLPPVSQQRQRGKRTRYFARSLHEVLPPARPEELRPVSPPQRSELQQLVTLRAPAHLNQAPLLPSHPRSLIVPPPLLQPPLRRLPPHRGPALPVLPFRRPPPILPSGCLLLAANPTAVAAPSHTSRLPSIQRARAPPLQLTSEIAGLESRLRELMTEVNEEGSEGAMRSPPPSPPEVAADDEKRLLPPPPPPPPPIPPPPPPVPQPEQPPQPPELESDPTAGVVSVFSEPLEGRPAHKLYGSNTLKKLARSGTRRFSRAVLEGSKEETWLQYTSEQRVRSRQMRKDRLNEMIAVRKRLEAERLGRDGLQREPSRLMRSYRTFTVKAKVRGWPSLNGASAAYAHYLSTYASYASSPSIFLPVSCAAEVGRLQGAGQGERARRDDDRVARVI